jgi:hypothetical protein
MGPTALLNLLFHEMMDDLQASLGAQGFHQGFGLRITSSTGRSNWRFTGLRLNLVLASASGLMFCFFMRLLVFGCV